MDSQVTAAQSAVSALYNTYNQTPSLVSTTPAQSAALLGQARAAAAAIATALAACNSLLAANSLLPPAGAPASAGVALVQAGLAAGNQVLLLQMQSYVSRLIINLAAMGVC